MHLGATLDYVLTLGYYAASDLKTYNKIIELQASAPYCSKCDSKMTVVRIDDKLYYKCEHQIKRNNGTLWVCGVRKEIK